MRIRSILFLSLFILSCNNSNNTKEKFQYERVKEEATVVQSSTMSNHVIINSNEIIFYDNINDLSEKIRFYKKNIKSRIKIAKNGKKKYFKLFNELKTTKYIVDKSLGKSVRLY